MMVVWWFGYEWDSDGGGGFAMESVTPKDKDPLDRHTYITPSKHT